MSKPRSANLQPLDGIKVLELGQLIAGPYAGKILAEFGADVIKVEPPRSGDPLRNWRMLKNGTSVWWQAQSRNKRSVAIDLRTPEGQELVRQMAREADVLIENFRPGTLEGWGLGWSQLSAVNPGLIMLRISGYGQTGPYAQRPGFGVIAEAMGGLRYLTGEPGRVPVRVGVSIGDSLAGLHGVIGVLLALYHRAAHGGRGQVVDVALYESVFSVMESLIPEYSAFGVVREPAGSALPGIAPTNAYRCVDGWVIIAGNGDRIFQRLMRAIGRDDLAEDSSLQNNAGRSNKTAILDAAIEEWTRQRTIADVLASMEQADVPAGRAYTARDIAEDAHYRAREMILSAPMDDGSTIDVPGIIPKLSETPGAVTRPAPRLGEHTRDVLGQLGTPEETREQLRLRGIIEESS